jgi:hypothetical protein
MPVEQIWIVKNDGNIPWPRGIIIKFPIAYKELFKDGPKKFFDLGIVMPG